MTRFYIGVSFLLLCALYLQIILQEYYVAQYLLSQLWSVLYYFFYASSFELLFQILHPTSKCY